MVKLGDLPNELVFSIVSCLGQPELNALAQTCRSMYNNANGSLYQFNRTKRRSSAAKWAAENGSIATLKHCASAGVNIADSSLELLHAAAMNKRTEMVQFLLTLDGIDAAYKDDSDWTPMFYACRSNASQNGSTALKAASRGCYTAVAQVLLEAGADPDIPAFGGWVPLHSAAKYGNLVLTELLIKYGANIETRQERGYTALALAIEAESMPVIRCLLAHGANVNTITNAGWSPLCLAADIGNEEVVTALLEYGADHTFAISNEWSALNLATYNGNISIIDVLLAHGALPDGCKDVGRNTIVNAIDKGHLDVAKKLLRCGARVDVRTERGETPLMRAVRIHKTDFVHLLLEHGANANTQNVIGWTPLITAAHEGHHKAIEPLLKASNGSLNYSDTDDRTALIHACMRGNRDVVDTLVRNYPVNLACRDTWGSTALSMAVRNGRTEIARALLMRLEPEEVHKDVDNLGRSIYLWATRSGDMEMLGILQDYCNTHGLVPTTDLSSVDVDAASFAEINCWCDVCGQCSIHDRDTKACMVCDEGEFLICAYCRDMGAGCRGKEHAWQSFSCQAD
ncbi:Ankyrin-3 [Beauveria bassiana]|nr:Ankyrin-3 [Beauveria bassiana]